MKKTIYRTIFFCLSVIALAGCDLELQKNYDYEASVDDPHVIFRTIRISSLNLLLL